MHKLFEARPGVVIVVAWCDDTVSEAHCARTIGSFKRNQLCGNAHIVAGPVPLALRSSFRTFRAAVALQQCSRKSRAIRASQLWSSHAPGVGRYVRTMDSFSRLCQCWLAGSLGAENCLSELESSMGSVQIEQKSYEMPPREGMSIAHFLTVADIERSAAQSTSDMKHVCPCHTYAPRRPEVDLGGRRPLGRHRLRQGL